MKNLLKKILLAAFAVTVLSLCSFAEMDIHADGVIPDEEYSDVSEAKDDEISIVVFGNSILRHGVSASIGWYGENWGMAASGPEKDYFHILKKKVKEMGFTNVKWSAQGLAGFERAFDDKIDINFENKINTDIAPTINRLVPDVVIFQLGENVDGSAVTTESYERALTLLAECCKGVNPDVEIIFCQPFWGGEAKVSGAKNAAMKTGFTYANLSQFNTPENTAIGQYSHSGVASHPGDKGMANIADEIFSQLEVILYRKYLDKEGVGVKLEGQYMTFDVPAQIINGRTMVPVRAISEAFGAVVGWDEETQTVTINTDDAYITMVLGKNSFVKNGVKIQLDVPAQSVNWRTMVPVRAISEALDCKVDWVEETRTVLISNPK